MAAIPIELSHLRDQVAAGRGDVFVSPRQLLQWFNSERRNAWTNRYVRTALSDLEIKVEPDFESVNIDAPLKVTLDTSAPSQPISLNGRAITESANTKAEEAGRTENSATASVSTVEPTLRIRILAAAINFPETVDPMAKIQQATTLMVAKDFSQIPVVRHRTVVGAISWRSLGTRLAFGLTPILVQESMETPLELRSDTPLLSGIEQIITHDYALIKDELGRLTGLVTTADLSAEFRSLSEPFLLLREVENYIRALITGKFSSSELGAFADPKIKREVRSAADLTFGEFVFALKLDNNWERLDLKIDRRQFVASLDNAHQIRNDVMHFDPDPIEAKRLVALREFARVLQTLATCNVLHAGK